MQHFICVPISQECASCLCVCVYIGGTLDRAPAGMCQFYIYMLPVQSSKLLKTTRIAL